MIKLRLIGSLKLPLKLGFIFKFGLGLVLYLSYGWSGVRAGFMVRFKGKVKLRVSFEVNLRFKLVFSLGLELGSGLKLG